MILNFIIDILLKFVDLILSFFDVLPSFPSALVSGINTLFDYMLVGANIANFLLPFSHLSVIIPIAIIIINFDNIYRLVMWVIRKLPFSID